MCESVELVGGMPKTSSMKIWVNGIINEYILVMYPGVDMEPIS